MIISDLLSENNYSQYRLSKETGIGQSTISDLCSGKTSIEKCAAGTLYKIAHALGTTVDAMLEAGKAETGGEYRSSFSIFRGNVCNSVKASGDIEFIIETLENDRIRKLYDKSWFPESFYLLAMVDYLSRINNLPVCKNYNDIRCQKLAKPIYSSDVMIQSALYRTDNYKKTARKNAIPEFLHFNIIEGEIRNVV